MIWSDREGFVFLPFKRKRWVEADAFSWPSDEAKIEQHLNDHSDADLYYTPNLFTQPYRHREHCQNPNWLYADLDTVNPSRVNLRPHVAVQSSPGRFQALWRLARPIGLENHEQYNQRLTYALGADKGGWDLTQVLRIPSTRNYKYPHNVSVRLAWSEPGTITLAKAKRFLDGVEKNLETLSPIVPPDLRLPSESSGDIRLRITKKLDQRLKYLLGANQVTDVGQEGRSGRLWELECRLLELGLTPEEVFVVVKDTVWNKYVDRRDSDLVLWREVQKAHLHVGTIIVQELESVNHRFSRPRPRVLSYSDIMGSPGREPDWAIEQWWTLGSHGIVAGLPKSFKSLVVTDMAVSLASESPFLGQFEINPRAVGPVLIVQSENSIAILRDRLFKISHSRGLQAGTASVGKSTIEFKPPPDLPILFYNDFGFDMTMTPDQESVEEIIRQRGIRTVIFDPLYLMIGGADENNARDIRPVLQWLLRIRNIYNIQVIVVHHWGKTSDVKSGRGTGGIKLLGSTTIYGWLEAGLYLEARRSGESVQIVVEREFRERPPAPPIGFNLSMGDIGHLGYEWSTIGLAGLSNSLMATIEKAGIKGASPAFIRMETGWGQKKTRKELNDLIDQEMIVEEKAGRSSRFYLRSEYTPSQSQVGGETDAEK